VVTKKTVSLKCHEKREIHVHVLEVFVCAVNLSGCLKKTVSLKCGRIIC